MATLLPRRAALMAAHIPATPPPTTTKSKRPLLSGSDGRSRSALLRPSTSPGSPSSRVRSTASKRASKPSRSWTAKAWRPFARWILPPCCQCHSGLPVPKTVSSAVPSTLRENFPGPGRSVQKAVQFFVRTHTLYSPSCGTSKPVTASRTGLPSPWASSSEDCITSINCGSDVHPPRFSNIEPGSSMELSFRIILYLLAKRI